MHILVWQYVIKQKPNITTADGRTTKKMVFGFKTLSRLQDCSNKIMMQFFKKGFGTALWYFLLNRGAYVPYFSFHYLMRHSKWVNNSRIINSDRPHTQNFLDKLSAKTNYSVTCQQWISASKSWFCKQTAVLPLLVKNYHVDSKRELRAFHFIWFARVAVILY